MQSLCICFGHPASFVEALVVCLPFPPLGACNVRLAATCAESAQLRWVLAGVERWQTDVAKRLQAMMLDAEAARSRAVTLARIAAEDLAATSSRLRAVETSCEQVTQHADALSLQLTVYTHTSEVSREQAVQHQGELLAMQACRISALSEELEHCGAQICDLTVALQTASEAEQEHAKNAAEMASALRATQTHLDAAVAQRDGLQMELAGTPERCGEERVLAIEARDANIKEFMASRVLPLLQNGCALML